MGCQARPLLDLAGEKCVATNNKSPNSQVGHGCSVQRIELINQRLPHKNKTPQIAGFCRSTHRTAGIWGDRGLPPTRLLSISRAPAGEGSTI